jgi:bifunctional DNA-binding transcriptional regulator/antitoxin component of YhaV-PrlF toxin-antitoxin module
MAAVVSSKSELVVPRSVRRRAGLKIGQKVEFKVSGGVINIVPKLPTADDEYTPAQRRVIDARLRKARKGPYYGPFDSVDEMLASMKGKNPRATRTKRRT